MSYLDSYIASNRSRAESAAQESEQTLQEVKDEKTSIIAEIQSEKEIALDNFTANFEDFISSSAGVNPQYISLVVDQVPQDYVEGTGLPYGQYSKGDNLYQLVYWDPVEEVWKDLGDSRPSKNYVDLAVSSGSTLSSITEFQNLIPTPEEKSKGSIIKQLASFHLGLGAGGGLFYWDENKSTAYHDGGLTTIDPNWNNGTFGNNQDPNWFERDPSNSVNLKADESLQTKGVWTRINIAFVQPEFGGAIPDDSVPYRKQVVYDVNGVAISEISPESLDTSNIVDNYHVLQKAFNLSYPVRLTSNCYYTSQTILMDRPQTVVGSATSYKLRGSLERNELERTDPGFISNEIYTNTASVIYTDQNIDVLSLKASSINLRDFVIDTSWVPDHRKAAIYISLDESVSDFIAYNIHIYGNGVDLPYESVDRGTIGVYIEETTPSLEYVKTIQQNAIDAFRTGNPLASSPLAYQSYSQFRLVCKNLHTCFKTTPKIWPIDEVIAEYFPADQDLVAAFPGYPTYIGGTIPTFANNFDCMIEANNVKRCYDVNTVTAGGATNFKAFVQATEVLHIPTLEAAGYTNLGTATNPYFEWPHSIIRSEDSFVDIFVWDLNNRNSPFSVNTNTQLFRPGTAFEVFGYQNHLGPHSKVMIKEGKVDPTKIYTVDSYSSGIDQPLRSHNKHRFSKNATIIHSLENFFHAARERFDISINDYTAPNEAYFDTLVETTTLTPGESGFTIENPDRLFSIGGDTTKIIVEASNKETFNKDLDFIEIVVDVTKVNGDINPPPWDIWLSLYQQSISPKRIDLFTVNAAGNTVASQSYTQTYEDKFYVPNRVGVDRALSSGSTEYSFENGNNPFRKLIIRIVGLGYVPDTNQDYVIESIIGSRLHTSKSDYGTILTSGGQRIYGDLTVDSISHPTGSSSHPQTKYLSFELNNNNVPNLGTPVTLFPQPVIIKSVYIRKYQSVTTYTSNPILSLYSLNSPSSIYNIFDIDLNNLPVEGKYLDISEYLILGGLRFGSKTGNPTGGNIASRILVYIEYVDFNDISEPNYTLP